MKLQERLESRDRITEAEWIFHYEEEDSAGSQYSLIFLENILRMVTVVNGRDVPYEVEAACPKGQEFDIATCQENAIAEIRFRCSADFVGYINRKLRTFSIQKIALALLDFIPQVGLQNTDRAMRGKKDTST